MHQRIFLLCFWFLSSPALAGSVLNEEAPCANFAKAGAIRAYKSEIGVVQGSKGIDYVASLSESSGDVYSYRVTIADNNDESESWEVDYYVQVRASGESCKVLKVKKLASRSVEP